MTQALYSKSYSHSDEVVSGFYISSDDKLLVVIGERHHYVFPLDADLKKVLDWPGRSKVTAQFNQFDLRDDGSVSGGAFLQVKKDEINSTEREFLENVGFKLDKDSFQLNRVMRGKYYSAKKVGSVSPFNKSYSIEIVETSSLPALIKVALTPVTVTVDGVLIIGGVTLLSMACVGSGLTGHKCFPGGL